MKVAELKNELTRFPQANVLFILPNGESVPAHAHVTEVARIDKRFIDCGGTLRNDSLCRLQIWSSDDIEHRLTATRLAKILDKAAPILESDDLEIDVEHELGHITQFPLNTIEPSAGEIILRLTERHTACLAMDKCKPKSRPLSDLNPMKFDFRDNQPSPGCCGGK
jgi:hypothetical protein